MKNIAASVLIMLFTIAATAQEQVPLTKQEKKALKQEQKKQNEAIMARNTAEALKSGRFVLKADQHARTRRVYDECQSHHKLRCGRGRRGIFPDGVSVRSWVSTALEG